MDRALANHTGNALRALFETYKVLAHDRQPARREKVEKLLKRSQGEPAAIMALMME